MTRSVAEKMGIRPGARALFIGAPDEALAAIELPALDVVEQFDGAFDYIHFFAPNQAALREAFPKLKTHLKPTGALWVSWPKAQQLQTDLTLPKVIEIGYHYGLAESKTLSVNSVWSAIKFTHPIPGKTYNNSFGKHPA